MAALSEPEIDTKLQKLTGWERAQVGGKPGISKTYQTGDFLTGLGFVTRVAVLAEKANHHPDVVLTYPRVVMQLTTHDSGGLTQRDFDLAAGIDALKI
jgi:4a-hydroxytetrahydrobiopterin dehydratase